ncbi:hypothetical protein SAMN05421780_101451 [Flexibacter flexilis DSM 6793]|uniref:Uncharacterized protein n=1 Tax=Flexibacter flexilis DSM 6793 TaxID=927664 RepID=A0A1I1DUR1_9BACT|nr:hypothetical protein [Flexibacter flexilis]SFB78126.1 hypothetical protein SAMN05421780_101451 [Flexibacter flexilis DSM 6793]
MAKFVSGEEQLKWLYDILWNAKKTLLIVTPHLKLDEYYKRLLNKHLYNPNIHIIVVFGKGDTDKANLIRNDIEFFKKFPNVSLVYCQELRSRYYANELKGLVTSLNLYENLYKINLDFGVADETPDSNRIVRNEYDTQAWDFCSQLAQANDAVFVKRPSYERKLYASLFGKNYVRSEVLLDLTTGAVENIVQIKNEKRRLSDFPETIELSPRVVTYQGKNENSLLEGDNIKQGYCIRTGKHIPFNPKRPMTDDSYDTWAFFMDYDYPEKYCHRTGKPSYGKTSMRNPILY